MRKFIGAVSAVVLLSSAAAVAAPYGVAGCGLGSIILKNEPTGAAQILAATLNSLFGNQTFGITTGTLNCGPAAADQVTQRTQVFVEANREVLAKDISRGQGETIVNLAAIAGCGNADAVGATLQGKFGTIFPSEQTPSTEVTKSLLETLKSEPSLACNQLG
jgi:Protein of unknown function (DUF3015)